MREIARCNFSSLISEDFICGDWSPYVFGSANSDTKRNTPDP